ncbi:MAG: lactate utilization protein B [Fimbriimonadales bacterium]
MSVEKFAAEQSRSRVDAVRSAAVGFTRARWQTFEKTYGDDLLAARKHAAAVKDHVLDNLADLLKEFEANCAKNGITVVWARDAKTAREHVLNIIKLHASPGDTIVKGKSMLTEEIHLNEILEESGYVPIETDLGEFVVQLDRETPSHIVAPIIHKSKQDVANTFKQHNIGDGSGDAEKLTMLAREELRKRFQQATVGISGVNFGVVDKGRIVVVSNEGNNRLSTTAPPVHIAMMGIEKLIPRMADLPTFLTLLASSATGQRITTYVHMISGPRKPDELDGPTSVYLVLVDNGRSSIVSSEFRSILRCIRCGACLNVCPVYRAASGHAYDHVYSGPLGLVLAPNLDGLSKRGDVVKSSSLCGACEEVCPVHIPLPDMILKLRRDRRVSGAKDLNWSGFRTAALNHRLWKLGLNALKFAGSLPFGPLSEWKQMRDLPQREGRSFRRWWHDRT